MPPKRWNNRRKAGCHQCGWVPGPGAQPLVADRTDGKQYCVKCLEAYYGPPPRDGEDGFWDAAACEKPSSISNVTEDSPLDSTTRHGREAAAKDHLEAAGPPESENKGATTEATPSVGSSCQKPLTKRNVAEENGALDEGSSVLIPTAMASFAKAVAELRAAASVANESSPCEADQLEELMILGEIYGENMASPEAGTPQPLTFSLQLNVHDESGHEIWVETPDGQVIAGVVQSLPPLVLHCALPMNYPADDRPIFALVADFLGAEKLQELEEELTKIADERTGEPLLFEWASLLQERGMAPKRLVLPGVDTSMDAALRLLAWDRSQRDEQRQHKLHTCPVCFDEVLGSKGLFLTCNHFGCRPCLEQMAQIHTGEAAISALCCPVTDCREPLGVDVLRELLGADSENFKRWEELSLRQCLDRMQDVVFCPRCDADSDGERIPCIEDADHCAVCSRCGFVFCGRCRDVYHPGTPCASTDERMTALEARAVGRGKDAESARAELMTLRHLAKTTKKCPGCCSTVEKIEGCSKMKCQTCGIYWCWRCGKEIKGYDHFASSECRLFDDEEIRRWNERGHQVLRAEARAHEARFLAQFMNPEEFGEQMRQCPRCKSDVMRDGKNNHMKCYACQTQFCAACFMVLPKKNPGSHFGRTGVCPQHSN